jgi:diacylglycerol kinase (ATP)
MRVALLHNTSAGSEDHTDDELTDLIQRAGHEIVHLVGRLNDLTAALQDQACELVVVAGGDGTVGRAACELAGWGIPLSILPLGTANNTALSLKLAASSLKKLIKSWKKAERVPYDLGLLDDGALRTRFSEGAGWGVFPAVIAEAKALPPRGTRQAQLKRDRKLFRAYAEQAPARAYEIEVDGRDYSGSYVLVEVVNVPFIGPQLELSPSSDSGDGALEILMAGDGERAALSELGKSGTSAPGALPTQRGKRIRVRAADGLLHRDGALVRHPAGARSFEISLETAAIHYLR